MLSERALNFDQWKTFSENSLIIYLPWIIVACDFSQSSFNLKKGILPLLTKYVS